jgi:Holliday junction resolvase-like predicted endonuclease
MAPLKQKGDLAEMLVAADLVRRGYKVALPFGEDWDYDLIVDRDGRLERVQVKYTESNGVWFAFAPARTR